MRTGVAETDKVILRVQALRLELATGEPVIEDVSLELARGEILGLVGESGSGKTTAGLALLGYTRPGIRLAGGTVSVDGHELTSLREAQLRPLRGRVMSYIPQEPGPSLNPSLRIGAAIGDVIQAHIPERSRGTTVTEALERAELPSEREFQRRFPHQLSGGQQQRVAIAVSLVCEPPLVVLDEPTTGLDVLTQARILEEVFAAPARSRPRNRVRLPRSGCRRLHRRPCRRHVCRAHRRGRSDRTVLKEPEHPYTRGLVASIPDHVVARRPTACGRCTRRGERPPAAPSRPAARRVARCETTCPPLEQIAAAHRVRCFEWRAAVALAAGEPVDAAESGASTRRSSGPVAARRASRPPQDSGCGRATCRSLSLPASVSRWSASPEAARRRSPAASRGFIRACGGTHSARRHTTRTGARGGARGSRADAARSSSRTHTTPSIRATGSAMRSPVPRASCASSPAEAAAEVARLLELVRLRPRVADRFPAELSGGERQRVAIARALAANPELLVCDEITSALDVSVQAAVLELLSASCASSSARVLFISHDLGVVASIADRMLVLERGVLCEEGQPAKLLASPAHPYTRRLIEAAPRLEGRPVSR